MSAWVLGVIGGSGLYDFEGLADARWVSVESPFGPPSDQILTGELAGVKVAFLPRHGRGHTLPPTAINSRANIDALKRLGCTDILSISAVGSLKDHLAPGAFVIVDQFVDRTFAREKSFFGTGLVAHVSMAHPTCARLSSIAAYAARAAGAPTIEGGTYLAMEGPQFSSRAESELYRAWGCSVIGMTGMPEAKLAREAELPYASLAMVTDYDCWRETPVEVGHIVEVLAANAGKARAMLRHFVEALPAERTPSPIDTCLDGAIITAPAARDPAMIARLSAIVGRALGQPVLKDA
ncbi:MAG TPA: S-methyl-5'-thioadenosine phosphorylase [Caulobacteraceae bacterium]|jgi:5'-methylthioadenosine phosphorylase